MNDKSYAVGWFTLALINAGLAESKGFSRLPTFLVSLLIGPIATLVIVVRPAKDANSVLSDRK